MLYLPLVGLTFHDRIVKAFYLLVRRRNIRILNIGDTPTCVRPQGSSIVDVTWSFADLMPFIRNWHVIEESESFSDHCYISFTLDTGRCRPPPTKIKARRWI